MAKQVSIFSFYCGTHTMLSSVALLLFFFSLHGQIGTFSEESAKGLLNGLIVQGLKSNG
jgi:hypothetical protein